MPALELTFTAGTTARADEVNGNFSAVADAVNGNDATITELVTEVEELRAALEECTAMDPSDEMVRVGSICIDRYEASLWDAPVGGNQITGEIPCNINGEDCDNIYARSVAGVQPRAQISWFQAQQALANSGKRLPTSAEWQMAVAGTPDDGVSCNVNLADPGVAVATRFFRFCASRWATYDMVGNLWEWTADWMPRPTTSNCTWGTFSDDHQGMCGAASQSNAPVALVRGGSFSSSVGAAGPFAILGTFPHTPGFGDLGFRGAR